MADNRSSIFAVSTALILFYFNLLYAIQKELEDPFGDDFSDLKLRKRFLTPLIEDFKTYTKALEPGGSISKRAEEVRKLLVYNEDPNTPHELPDGDGQETAAAADGQSAAVVKALDALRDALLEQK